MNNASQGVVSLLDFWLVINIYGWKNGGINSVGSSNLVNDHLKIGLIIWKITKKIS